MKRELILFSACIAILMLLMVSLGVAEDIVVQENAIRESLYNNPEQCSEGYFAVCIEGKCGFINAYGDLICEPQWDSVWPFSEGLALVMAENKYSYIDTNGMVVISLEAENAQPFHEGFAAVKIDGRWGFIDTSGTLVIEPQWDIASCFSEGLAAVKVDDKYGFIDATGLLVIEPQWKKVWPFKEGHAIVSLDGIDPETWLYKISGFIDKTGALVIEGDAQWKMAESFSENTALIYKGEGNWTYIDINGSILFEYTIDSGRRYSFSDGLARVNESDYENKYSKDSFFNLSGEIVIDIQGCASEFHDGLAVVYKDGKYGYIYTKGTVVIDLIWDEAYDFSDGYAIVCKDGLGYIIDTNGNITF